MSASDLIEVGKGVCQNCGEVSEVRFLTNDEVEMCDECYYSTDEFAEYYPDLMEERERERES